MAPPSSSSSSSSSQHKNNIIAIPFPIYGHITPMLQIATRLASSGFRITFVNIERNHAHVSRSLSHYPPHLDIRLVSLPDNELPPDCGVPEFSQFQEIFRSRFEEFVEQLQLVSEASPPVCILSDVHVGWTQDVATKFQLPRIALWTSNASECQVYFHAPRLISQGYLPFKGISKTVAIHLPGLPPLQPKDFPSLLQIEDAANIRFSFFIDQTKRMAEADIVLINSFLELENSVFDALREELFKVYPIGPLFLLDEKVTDTASVFSEDEDRCLRWLDKQAVESVLYVSFGTISPLSDTRIASIALGLERSEQPFLWALRFHTDHLPDGFMDRTRDKGLVVAWAPQVHVLRHPSVGGFLTHCGWNSTMESLSVGIPMICSPVRGDQTLTCKMLVEEWKVGLGFSESDCGFATEEELAKLARELLAEEKGGELRKRAAKLSDAVRRATQEGGEAWQSLSTLCEHVKAWM